MVGERAGAIGRHRGPGVGQSRLSGQDIGLGQDVIIALGGPADLVVDEVE